MIEELDKPWVSVHDLIFSVKDIEERAKKFEDAGYRQPPKWRKADLAAAVHLFQCSCSLRLDACDKNNKNKRKKRKEKKGKREGDIITV